MGMVYVCRSKRRRCLAGRNGALKRDYARWHDGLARIRPWAEKGDGRTNRRAQEIGRTFGWLRSRHTFTHFHLILQVRIADLPQGANPEVGQFIEPEAFRPSDLPTVMRKAFDLARDAFDNTP